MKHDSKILLCGSMRPRCFCSLLPFAFKNNNNKEKDTWSLALASLTVAGLGCEMLITDLVSIVCVIYNVYN